MESSWPEAHRRDGDPQPPQFRAFALPGISIATLRNRDRKEEESAGGGGGGDERWKGFKQCRDSTREHERAHTYAIHMHMHVCARDCVYAESYLPRLKSHRGESRGRSALGIASARAIASTPLRFPPPIPSRFPSPPPRPSSPRLSATRCIAVCRCIVSIFTQGRRAGGLLFPRFSRAPLPSWSRASARGDLTLRVLPTVCADNNICKGT